MDMARPSGAPTQPMPVAAPARQTAQQPLPPVASPAQKAQPLAPQPVARQARPMPAAPAPQAPQPAPQSVAQPHKVRKAHPFWRGLLQVIVSLLVIVGVAAVIVALYLKYYQ